MFLGRGTGVAHDTRDAWFESSQWNFHGTSISFKSTMAYYVFLDTTKLMNIYLEETKHAFDSTALTKHRLI